MIVRHALTELNERLSISPAVVLLGARQVGKSTLGRKIQTSTPGSVFLDLENPTDRAKLTNPAAFWSAHRHTLVILDEVQAMPECMCGVAHSGLILPSAIDTKQQRKRGHISDPLNGYRSGARDAH